MNNVSAQAISIRSRDCWRMGTLSEKIGLLSPKGENVGEFQLQHHDGVSGLSFLTDNALLISQEGPGAKLLDHGPQWEGNL